MDQVQDLDSLRGAYKRAVEEWVAAIRAEEDLATPDHAIPAVDVWEHAGFTEEEARSRAKQARKEYEDALRKVNFNF
jgi:predicted RNase H-like HicB family nuclease